MRARELKPPLLWVVKMFFPKADLTKTWVTFGKDIYGPENIPQDVWVHEQVHIKQQRNKFVAIFFFILYTFSKTFRYKMELPGYQAQMDFIKSKTTPEKARYFHGVIVGIMSGPMYNNMVTPAKAAADLKLQS